jgi:excisionase family DNA binding protein
VQADLLAAVERATVGASPATLVKLLGDLERFKAILWQRLLLTATAPVAPPPSDPVDEIRHLTPHQVGELLNLKPAYVHELCRTGRIAATKSGKYWMIPLTDLRRWLYQKRDVDPDVRARLESVHSRGDSVRRSHAGAVRHPRGIRTPV